MESAKSKMRLHEKGERSLILSWLYGFLFTALFSLAFLAVASLCAYQTEDPASLLKPLSYVSLALSALICGFSSAKFAGRRGALLGLVSGVFFCFVLYTAAAVLGVSVKDHLLPTILLYLLFSLLSLFGGILGGKKKNRHKTHMH